MGILLDDQPYWDLVSLFDLLLDRDSDHPGDIDADDHRRLITTDVKKRTGRRALAEEVSEW